MYRLRVQEDAARRRFAEAVAAENQRLMAEKALQRQAEVAAERASAHAVSCQPPSWHFPGPGSAVAGVRASFQAQPAPATKPVSQVPWATEADVVASNAPLRPVRPALKEGRWGEVSCVRERACAFPLRWCARVCVEGGCVLLSPFMHMGKCQQLTPWPWRVLQVQVAAPQTSYPWSWGQQ